MKMKMKMINENDNDNDNDNDNLVVQILRVSGQFLIFFFFIKKF